MALGPLPPWKTTPFVVFNCCLPSTSPVCRCPVSMLQDPPMCPSAPQKFDAYAEQYRQLVDTSLKGSGESHEYFTEYKMKCLRRLGAPVNEPFLDFGAGTGSVTRALV